MRRALLLAALALAACGDGDLDDRVAAVPDGAGVALADGTHFGFVTALDPVARELELDPAELRAGETEDDIEIRNPDDTTHRLPISHSVVIRLLQPCCELTEHAFTDWLAGFEPDERTFYGTSASRYEVTVEDGTVVAVDEVYLP
jgi:hypothetical protein